MAFGQQPLLAQRASFPTTWASRERVHEVDKGLGHAEIVGVEWIGEVSCGGGGGARVGCDERVGGYRSGGVESVE